MSKLSTEQREFLETATLRYSEHLPVAAEWLAARGVELEHAASNAIGVVIDPLPQHQHLRGRLAIPYLTDMGPVNMTFRCMEPHDCGAKGHGKYLLQQGLRANLFGVQSLGWAEDWIVVAEGEIDCLIWHQIGVPAIGISGAAKWQDHWKQVLEDFSRIYVAEDGDEAGQKLWDRVNSVTTAAIRMRMPDGEDTNSMYLKLGKDYLLGRIRK